MHDESDTPVGSADIYETIGVSPDVTAAVAQAMYWTKIARLREAELNGDSAARERMEELSQALAVVLDEERRAAHDAQHKYRRPPADPATDPAVRARRRGDRKASIQVAAVLSMVFAVALGIVGSFLIGELVWALSVALALLSLVLLLAAGDEGREVIPRRRGPSPLDILQLAEDASIDAVELAYRTLAGRWLSRLRTEPERAVDALQRLDAAHAEALALLVGAGDDIARVPAGPVPVPADPPLALRVARVSFRVAATAVHMFGRLLGRAWSIDLVARRLLRLGSPARLGDRLGVLERTAPVDLERRLSESVRALAEEAVEESPAADRMVDVPLFQLVLESAAGARRLPVGGRPLRIGTSADCDVVVQNPGAEAPAEHALLWVSGNDLVLHATAECLVNDEAATWARLEEQDVVGIGSTTFRIERTTAGAQSAA